MSIRLRFVCTAVALALAAPLAAQPSHPHPAKSSAWFARTWVESFQSRQGPEQTERATKTFKVGPNGSLDVSSVSGDVVVSEVAGDTMTVEAVKRVRSRTPEGAKEQFANTQLVMSQSGNRVEVKINYIGQRNHASVDFTVTAPAGTTVNARSVSGNVRVPGIKGEVRAESVSGDVTASGTPDLALAKSGSGDIDVSGVSGQDELTAGSISGNVTLRGIKARVVNADSVSGEIQLFDVACERATVKSISGEVDYTGPIAKTGRYELKSHSGDVRMTLSADIGFELEAQSFSGNVRSDLPITTRAGETIGRRRGLRGTHGDGGALLILNTFSGDITLAKR